MPALADLVLETSTTTGAGNLAVARSGGHRRGSEAFGLGDNGARNPVMFIVNRNASAQEWEVAPCWWSDADTMVRGTPIRSSNGDAAVVFTAGTKQIANAVSATEQVPQGACQLVKSGANLVLSRLRGRRLFINGVNETIPAAGVTLSPVGLAPGTTYFIYAAMIAGAMALEASATGHAVDASYGHEIKAADPTRSLVGMARTIAGPGWQDVLAQRFVRSWFNDPGIGVAGSSGTERSSAHQIGDGFAELHTDYRAEFLTWGGAKELSSLGQVSTPRESVNNATAWQGVGVDGVASVVAITQATIPTATQDFPGAAVTPYLALTEGYHYVTFAVASNNGSTGTWRTTTTVFFTANGVPG